MKKVNHEQIGKSEKFNSFTIIISFLFTIFIVYKGLHIPSSGRLRIGLMLLSASAVFGLLSQNEVVRGKFYQAQMEWYRKRYSEKEIQKNGIIATIALAISGTVLILMSLIK